MKPILKALSCLSPRALDALLQAGAVARADAAAVGALHGQLWKRSRPTLGQRLAGEVEIRKSQEEEPVEVQTITKEERSRRTKVALDTAVDEYVAKHGCTRSRAAEMVAFSPAVTELVRLEKLERGCVTDEHTANVLKSGGVTDPSPLGPRMQNSPTVGGGVQRPVAALDHFNDFPAVSSQTRFNVSGDSNAVVDAATLLEQRARALKDKDPGLSLSAAYDTAMKSPDIRKAYADERDARLASASRLHG